MKSAMVMGLVVLSSFLALVGVDIAGAQENLPDNAVQRSDSKFWGSAEYLYWFREERKIPPLVTTSSPGTPLSSAGVLGDVRTAVLFGNEKIDENGVSGGRANFGIWFDKDNRIGAGGSFFILDKETVNFSRSSDSSGNPTLAVPFYDAGSSKENSLIVSYDGITSGNVNISSTNNVYGVDLFVRWNFSHSDNWQWDVLLGYAYSRIEDDLSINSRNVTIGGLLPGGTTFDMEDRFKTQNDFNCLSLGLMGEYRKKPWGVSGLARLRVGTVRQEAEIRGRTVTTIPGVGASSSSGGLFAQSTNAGSYDQDKFAFIPEAQLKLNYQLMNNLDLTVGYTVIWWNSVALAGEQMDRSVNTTQIGGGALVGPAEPSFSFHTSGFLVHGFSAGLALSF